MPPLHSSITWVAKAVYAVSILQSPASFIRRKNSVSANKNNSCPVNFEILHSVFLYAHMDCSGKKRVQKTGNPALRLQSAGFQSDKIRYFLSGTNYAFLKMFVIRTLSYQVKPDNV